MRASWLRAKWNEFCVISSFLFYAAHVRFSNSIVKILPYFSCVYFSIVWYKLFKSLKLRQFGKSRNDRFSVCLSLCLSLPTYELPSWLIILFATLKAKIDQSPRSNRDLNIFNFSQHKSYYLNRIKSYNLKPQNESHLSWLIPGKYYQMVIHKVFQNLPTYKMEFDIFVAEFEINVQTEWNPKPPLKKKWFLTFML